MKTDFLILCYPFLKFEKKNWNYDMVSIDHQIKDLLIVLGIFIAILFVCITITIVCALLHRRRTHTPINSKSKPKVRTGPKPLDVPKAKPIVLPRGGIFAAGFGTSPKRSSKK